MRPRLAVLVAVVLCGLGGSGSLFAQPAPDGAALYNANCAGCHGALSSSGVRNTSAALIQAGINGNAGGMGRLAGLTPADVQAIAAALHVPPTIHVSGSITAIAGGSLTVQPASGSPVSFATGSTTTVSLNGKAVTLAGLKVGMTVSASTVSGTATSIAATVPIVSVSGAIITLAGGNVTVQPPTGTSVTFGTSATTVVTVKGMAATVASLKVGMHMTGTTELGVATAIHATVPVVSVSGAITALAGGNVTVQPATGAAVTFGTSAATVVTVKGVAATVAGLKVGMHMTGTTELGVATAIHATVPVVAVSGAITALAGGNVTVQPATGSAVTFGTDSSTKITITGKAASLADLKVGMHMTGTTELGVATAIYATIPVVTVSGTIATVAGANVTVQPRTGAPVTFSTNGATVIKVGGKVATVADLKAGMTLTAVSKLGLATSITAQ